MKVFKIGLYFAIISFLACGKSKGVVSKLAEVTKALNAYASAIEENSTDCNKMARAIQKPAQNLAKISIELRELKDKKIKLTKENISAKDRVKAALKVLLIKCANHPRIDVANKALFDALN